MVRLVICGLLAAACGAAPLQPLPTASGVPASALTSGDQPSATVERPPRAVATPTTSAWLPPQSQASVSPTSAPEPPVAFGDGTHVIGDDVEPGTYRTIEYTQSCYWVRLAGFESGLEDWVASAIGPGYHVVTIAPEDAGFDSDRCGDWTAELAPVANDDGAIGEGTYIVGLDMAPGRWQASSGANCYWARLSGFGGTQPEVIEQGLTAEALAPVVTVAETDAGFTSNGCGEWRAALPDG